MLCVYVVCLCCVGQDDLTDMFQSAGNLAFDLQISDNDNMAIAGHKAEKVDTPSNQCCNCKIERPCCRCRDLFSRRIHIL